MQVKVANIPGKKVEHQGIKVQLLGQIELASERGHPHTFISLGAQRQAPAQLFALLTMLHAKTHALSRPVRTRNRFSTQWSPRVVQAYAFMA